MAAAAAAPEERAAALLGPLGRVLPFDGAWVALCDDEGSGHRSLVSTGWDRRTAAYLDGPVLAAEIEQLGMHRSTTPLRVADFPVPPSELRSWAECLLPAGLREGLGTCLFAADGRHVGFLGLFTGSADVPSDGARDLLAALAPTLGRALDPMRSVAAAARAVHGACSGVVLTRTGAVAPLPGLPGHAALRPGSRLLAVACAAMDGPQSSFLLPSREAEGGFLRVTVLDAPDDAPRAARAVVVLSPAGDLLGLTPRELEVLGLLVEGRHNAEAAAVLGITSRTVATHVEHVLLKLEAGSRVLAAVRAQRRGLFVPPALLATALA